MWERVKMKEYITKLNNFLKPYKAIEREGVIKYWVDNQTYYFLDYSRLPWVYGLNNRGDKIEINQFMDIQLAKTSVALYLKGVLFDKRLDRLDYDCNFKSLSEVRNRLNKNKLEDYCSINIFLPNKINLIVRDRQRNIYFTTIDNQKILLNKDSEYILKDFYKAVVDLYIRILDFNDYKKIFNDDIKWKEFYEIYGYVKSILVI